MTVEDILSGEVGRRFYGDGPPQWRQGRNGQPPKTAAEARRERHRLALALRRDASRAALALAEKLEGCRQGRRCLSGACPVCGRALQRMFVHATPSLAERHDGDMEAINLVSATGAIPYRRLDEHDVFERIERRLRRALDRLRLLAVGGFDISANEHEADEFEPHWMPHAWILAPGRRARRVENELRDWFPNTDTVPRPVHMKRFDGNPAGFAYALKPDFLRRISLEPATLPDGSRSTHSTRGKPIWGEPRVELALALDRAGLDARLFLRGYELVIADGDVDIVPSAPNRRRPDPAADRKRDRRAPTPGR
jgi:hypothetical protein